MKLTETKLRQIIKEELLNEEYFYNISFNWNSIVSEYMKWEKASFDNYSEMENAKNTDEGWNTKDAKVEILEELLSELQKKSKRKDKIKIS